MWLNLLNMNAKVMNAYDSRTDPLWIRVTPESRLIRAAIESGLSP